MYRPLIGEIDKAPNIFVGASKGYNDLMKLAWYETQGKVAEEGGQVGTEAKPNGSTPTADANDARFAQMSTLELAQESVADFNRWLGGKPSPASTIEAEDAVGSKLVVNELLVTRIGCA